ncbi:phosphatidylserine decarboxylase family protein [bacterium]|nr:phosphatidylserine decarboxylase family protein [bacterium]
MNIARAGVPIILGLLLLHLALLVTAWLSFRWQWGGVVQYTFLVLALTAGLVAAFSLYFFRDPQRQAPPGEALVLSPADGRVLAVETIEETDYIKGPALKVSIFMSVFSVHVNRYPVSGSVQYRAYRPGKFLNASFDKASLDNEAMSLGLCTADGTRILVRQIAGLVARRIVCPVAEGDSAVRGERYGMIRFGSRLEVFLPTTARVAVSPGQSVTAGESVLAELPCG